MPNNPPKKVPGYVEGDKRKGPIRHLNAPEQQVMTDALRRSVRPVKPDGD